MILIKGLIVTMVCFNSHQILILTLYLYLDFTIDNEPSCRFLTLLVYLNDQESEDSGGETAFPKTSSESLGLSSDDKTKGFKVHAGKGSAILFYNQLADGNGDYLSLHSGLPVRKGCKWAANIWVSA